MEFRIISRELVKPSSPEIIQTKPPHRLCLFDQLTPLTFVHVILFYANPDHSNSVLAGGDSRHLLPFLRPDKSRQLVRRQLPRRPPFHSSPSGGLPPLPVLETQGNRATTTRTTML
ncbi:unnamed protein product [Linum trigynum]|uniref:Uncharacterized protein n=1 Tax=Linum trigynum TaxID=586398 RepID=A0AAV2D8H4_9ROSI